MGKLYFKYGAMGSSKTASLLMTKFNYEQKGFKVLLLKPAIDSRDGRTTVMSRMGLSSDEAIPVAPDEEITPILEQTKADVILIDEAQFLKEKQVDELHDIVDRFDVPVICYGLLTDFTTHMFEGSKRLVEISESLMEIKTVCKCGRKATVNARLDENGNVLKTGEQIVLGGDDKYTSMCYRCWNKA